MMKAASRLTTTTIVFSLLSTYQLAMADPLDQAPPLSNSCPYGESVTLSPDSVKSVALKLNGEELPPLLTQTQGHIYNTQFEKTDGNSFSLHYTLCPGKEKHTVIISTRLFDNDKLVGHPDLMVYKNEKASISWENEKSHARYTLSFMIN